MSAIAWRSGAPIDVETRRYHLSTAFTHGGRDSRVKVSPPTAEESEVTKRKKQKRNKTDAGELGKREEKKEQNRPDSYVFQLVTQSAYKRIVILIKARILPCKRP